MRVTCPHCGSDEVEYLGGSSSSGCYAEFERDYFCHECKCEFVAICKIIEKKITKTP